MQDRIDILDAIKKEVKLSKSLGDFESSANIWSWDPLFLRSDDWLDKGDGSYQSIKIKDADKIYNLKEFEKLQYLVENQLKGSNFTISRAYGIHNQILETSFNGAYQKLLHRINREDIFNLTSWKNEKSQENLSVCLYIIFSI